MIKFKEHDPVYELVINVLVCTHDEFAEEFKNDKEVVDELEGKDGGVVDSEGDVYVWLDKKELSNSRREDKISLIAHEAFHATEHALLSHGVGFRVDGPGNEHFAYYLGWIVKFITAELIEKKLL